MRHPKALEWEERLDRIFDRIDKSLEEEFGDAYSLHPVRARRKPTGNPEHDGLFRLGGVFSAGFGSEKGAGYIVRVEIVTLDDVPDDIEDHYEDFVAERLKQELPVEFPGVELNVERDGPRYKIYGDLSLGKA
ncbi:hypothetical protein BVX97_01915 [bacterium E08(2017)]|nr:hypothetical protein BVX97_01915 [bacterium E08(2017)]